MRPPGILTPFGSVRSGNAATRGTCQPGSGGRVLRTRDVLRVAPLRAPGTEVQGVNSESLLRSLYGRSAVRPLAVGGVTALLGTLLSCGYGSGYSIQTVSVPNSIAVADVNGDGVPDLLVATTSDQGNPTNPGFANVILDNKTTAGTFQKGVPYPTTGTNPSSIAVADLTRSGSLDLVIANYASGSVSVFMHGSTPGSYMPAVTVTTGGLPNQVVIGDGKPDVVAATSDASGNNGAVYVFYQSATSPGTFLGARVFPAGARPQAVRTADVNGDGLPDIVVANFGPGADGTGSAGVSVLLQDAANPGSFLAPVTYATQSRAIDVAVGDLNGDGKPDLVVANLGPAPTGSVSVLLQDAAQPGVFLSATSYAGFGQPLSVTIADL